MAKKGVFIINLGTPDSTSVKDVRKYLREFLMDEKVIDIPAFNRWLLVNLIIAPIRGPKSAAEYRKVWTDRGSPLMYHGTDLEKALQNELGTDYEVVFGMRYQNPSMKSALERFSKNLEEIVVIPLYPQYAEATTGSTLLKLEKEAAKISGLPKFRIIDKFPDHPLFIDAFAALAKIKMEAGNYDHIVFSYHGLPERQIIKASDNGYCKLGECCSTYHSKNEFCYRAQCFQTSRKLAEALNLQEDQYTVCFQSRLGKAEWIKPYTEDKLHELAAQGVKKVLALCPAFTADCLETTVEVGEMYQEEFLEDGGEQWDLVESLNSSDKWVECLKSMIEN